MDIINSTLPEAYPGGPVRHEWKIVASLVQKDPSINKKALAEALGYSYQTILTWFKDPRYQMYESWVLRGIIPDLPAEVVKTRADAYSRVHEKFGFHAEEMQDRLLTILETTDDPRIQKEIAQDWLDRAGMGAPKTATKAGVSVHISAELAEEFLTRAREAGLLAIPAEGAVIIARHDSDGEASPSSEL